MCAVLVMRGDSSIHIPAHRNPAEDTVADLFDEGRRSMLKTDRGRTDPARLLFKHSKVQELVVIDFGRRGRRVDIMGLLVLELAKVPLREPIGSLGPWCGAARFVAELPQRRDIGARSVAADHRRAPVTISRAVACRNLPSHRHES